MIGYYGDIIFETSDSRILTFTGFKVETAGRWATHELIGIKPITEFIGPSLSTVTFSIHLNGRFGVKPRAVLDKLRDYANTGVVDYLVIGGRPLGDGLSQWALKSVSEAWNTILNGGELFSANVDLSLEEYIVENATDGY